MREILSAFNDRRMDAATACERLQIGKSQLYALRAQWLRERGDFAPRASGGSRHEAWPREACATLVALLKVSAPLNFALLADELHRRHGFIRSRAAVAAFARQHCPELLAEPLRRGPKPKRRWQCAAIGDLWQHDSSPHPWWPAPSYPILLLSLDDHSRKLLGGRFVESETTWNHFRHWRAIIERHGLPRCAYTDGLSLFGHHGTRDGQDPVSQFQRAFLGLGSAHRVAPTPEAKGKIERRFGYFQKRLCTLLAAEKITTCEAANELLDVQLAWHNAHHPCRTTGLTPDAAWELALREKRSHLKPVPPAALLDLHFALYLQRKVNRDHTVDFLGRAWPLAHTKRKSVTIVHHPEQCFWVIPEPPSRHRPVWPDILAHHKLA